MKKKITLPYLLLLLLLPIGPTPTANVSPYGKRYPI